MTIYKLFSLAWKTIFIVLLFGVLQDRTTAQVCTIGGGSGGDSCSMQAEYQVEWATWQKCGYTELCGMASTPPKWYLQQVTVYAKTDTADYTNLDDADTFPSCYEHIHGSLNINTTNKYNTNDCSLQTTYLGNATYMYHDMYNDYVNGPATSQAANAYNATMDPSTGAWSDGGSTYNAANQETTYFSPPILSSSYTNPCTSPVTTTSQTSATGVYYEGIWSYTITTSTSLSEEYTDVLLRNITTNYIPAFTDTWIIKDSADGRFIGYAAYYLDSDHYTDWCFRMEYRFRLFGAKDAVYKVEWDVITIYLDGVTPPSTQHLSEEVAGTGDPNGAVTSIHLADVPFQPSIVFVVGWKNTMVSPGTGGS